MPSLVRFKEKPTRYTRWFKYDRDCLYLFTHKSVPVIFELPCILISVTVIDRQASFKIFELAGCERE